MHLYSPLVSSRVTHLEFHISHEPPPTGEAAHGWVRWVVVRIDVPFQWALDVTALVRRDHLQQLDTQLSALPRLEKVVVELDTKIDATTVVAGAFERSRRKVFVWREGEARAYARRWREVANASAQLPISPRYYHASITAR